MNHIGRYELVDEVARGGAGVVYKARDPAGGRLVALKLLHSARETVVRRFQREAETLARVRHPNVVPIHEAGSDRGRPFLVMAFVPGESLEARIVRDGPFAPRDAAALALQVARGLGAVHAQGIVHRDLKPANVLLDDAGRAQITDFGLVRDLDASLDATRVSQAGQYLGTPGYWPPEQVRGDLDAVGPTADVFGLGGVLFALLTGTPPHLGDTFAESLALLAEPARAPSALRAGLPADLDAIVLACLARDPARRYPSAQALAEDLERFLADEPVQAERRRAPRVVAAVALVTALAGGGVAVALRTRPAAQPAGGQPAPASTPALADPTDAIPPLLAAADALARDPALGPAFVDALLRCDDPGLLAAARERLAPDLEQARALVDCALAAPEGWEAAWSEYNRHAAPAERVELAVLRTIRAWASTPVDWGMRSAIPPQSDPYLDAWLGVRPLLADPPPAQQLSAGWRLLYARAQGCAARDLLSGALGIEPGWRPGGWGDELGLTRDALGWLLAAAPQTPAAARLRVLHWMRNLGGPPLPPQAASLGDPVLDFVQSLSDLERDAQLPPPDLLRRLAPRLEQGAEPPDLADHVRQQVWATAADCALMRVTPLAYAAARARGGPLDDLSAPLAVLADAQDLGPRRAEIGARRLHWEVIGEQQTSFVRLLGSEPGAVTWHGRTPSVCQLQFLVEQALIRGQVTRARDLLVEGGMGRGQTLTIDGLCDHLEALGAQAIPPGRFDAAEAGWLGQVPWHEPPHVADVVAGRGWWPGAR